MAYGCFYTTMVELSDCNRDHKAHVPKIFIIQLFMKRSTNLGVDKSKDVNEVGNICRGFQQKFSLRIKANIFTISQNDPYQHAFPLVLLPSYLSDLNTSYSCIIHSMLTSLLFSKYSDTFPSFFSSFLWTFPLAGIFFPKKSSWLAPHFLPFSAPIPFLISSWGPPDHPIVIRLREL